MANKSWTKMNADELAEATREFDSGPGPHARKPPARELAKHLRAIEKSPKRGRGRPVLGDGAVRVLFTIEPRLLDRLDAFARKHGMKRSRLIVQSVESYMRNGKGAGKASHHSSRTGESSSDGSKPTPLAAMMG